MRSPTISGRGSCSSETAVIADAASSADGTHGGDPALRPIDRFAQCGNVRGRAATAPADGVNSEVTHECCELRREFLRALRIDRFALRPHQRQPRIWNDADERARTLAEIADRVAHLCGTGRTIQTDDLDLERVENGANRTNVGTEQHPPFGDQGRLRLNRDSSHSARKLEVNSRDRCLELEQILHRLEQQEIGAAIDERSCLLGVDVTQPLVRDVGERRIGGGDEHSRRPHRAGDEAWPLRRRVGGTRLSRDLGGAHVDLARALAERVLVELQSRTRERVRLDDIGTRSEIRLVDRSDDLRTR